MTTSLAPGSASKRATIVDVARHAGVSTASASKVLRGAPGVSREMRDRVHRSMEALSYRPHRSARAMRGRTYSVGVMLSDIENPFFSLLVQGMHDVFQADGYELLIAPSSSDEASQNARIDSLIDHQMDGLVLVSPRSHEDHLERIGEQVATVVIGPHGPSASHDTISGDDATGAGLVVDYLVALGHRRIAFVSNQPPRDLVNLPESVRERGFLAAMERHGLGAEAVVLPGTWTYEGGRAAGQRVLESYPRPTAVFAGADVAALGLLSRCLEAGAAIPGDLSVVGYDNSPTGALPPIGLSSVDQSGLEMGRIAARLLLERIDGRTTPRNELIAPSMVVRSTTAAPAG